MFLVLSILVEYMLSDLLVKRLYIQLGVIEAVELFNNIPPADTFRKVNLHSKRGSNYFFYPGSSKLFFFEFLSSTQIAEPTKVLFIGITGLAHNIPFFLHFGELGEAMRLCSTSGRCCQVR